MRSANRSSWLPILKDNITTALNFWEEGYTSKKEQIRVATVLVGDEVNGECEEGADGRVIRVGVHMGGLP